MTAEQPHLPNIPIQEYLEPKIAGRIGPGKRFESREIFHKLGQALARAYDEPSELFTNPESYLNTERQTVLLATALGLSYLERVELDAIARRARHSKRYDNPGESKPELPDEPALSAQIDKALDKLHGRVPPAEANPATRVAKEASLLPQVMTPRLLSTHTADIVKSYPLDKNVESAFLASDHEAPATPKKAPRHFDSDRPITKEKQRRAKEYIPSEKEIGLPTWMEKAVNRVRPKSFRKPKEEKAAPQAAAETVPSATETTAPPPTLPVESPVASAAPPAARKSPAKQLKEPPFVGKTKIITAIAEAREAYAGMRAYDEQQAQVIGQELFYSILDASRIRNKTRNLSATLAELSDKRVSAKTFEPIVGSAQKPINQNNFAASGAIDPLMAAFIPDPALAQEAANYIVGIPWAGHREGHDLIASILTLKLDSGQLLRLHRLQERKRYGAYAESLGIPEGELSKISGYTKGIIKPGMIDQVAQKLGCSDPFDLLLFRRSVLQMPMTTQEVLDQFADRQFPLGAANGAPTKEVRHEELRQFFNILQNARELSDRRKLARAIAENSGGGEALTLQVYNVIKDMAGADNPVEGSQRRLTQHTSLPVGTLIARYAYPNPAGEKQDALSEKAKACVSFLCGPQERGAGHTDAVEAQRDNTSPLLGH